MSHPWIFALGLGLMAGLAYPAGAQAQSQPTATNGCNTASKGPQDAATPSAKAGEDSTSPAASGSSGWSGGTGGSHIGTSHDNAGGANPDHPATASGINPIDKAPNPAAAPPPC